VLKHRSLHSHTKTGADIWILAAINTPHHNSVCSRQMEELLTAEGIVHFYIPPLRQRAEDISPLFDYYWDYLTSNLKKLTLKRPNKIIMEMLIQYQWPGNIQELQLFIKDAIFMGDWYKALGKYNMI
jgi:Nif-specific regulatory protein